MAEVTSLITEFFSKPYNSKSLGELETTVKTVFSSKNLSLETRPQTAERIITMEEVSWHEEPNDCWVIIFDRVYDVTDFLHEVSNTFFTNFTHKIILKMSFRIFRKKY